MGNAISRPYSFKDVKGTFLHPEVGAITLDDVGCISLGISYSSDMSSQQTSADGRTLTNKININNGVVTLVVQQNSESLDWFRKYANYLVDAPTIQWNRAVFTIINFTTGEQTNAIGVSVQKPADITYATEGTDVTITFLAEHITGV